jgi:hypothetical protein
MVFNAIMPLFQFCLEPVMRQFLYNILLWSIKEHRWISLGLMAHDSLEAMRWINMVFPESDRHYINRQDEEYDSLNIDCIGEYWIC